MGYGPDRPTKSPNHQITQYSNPLSDSLRSPARGLEFLRCLSAEFVRAYRQRLADIAPRQNLDRPVPTGNEPVLAQQFGRHDRAGVELRREQIEVHYLVLDAKMIVESSLRYSAMERHLAALEASLELEPRAGFRALVSAPGRLALTRALPAPDALLRVLGALRRFQIRQIHKFCNPAILQCVRRLFHVNQVPDLVNHATGFGRIFELDCMANAAQTQTLHHRCLLPVESGWADQQRHLDRAALRVRTFVRHP